MTSFADQMATFTDHLRSSIRERGESLTRIHEATGVLLADARTFMSRVTAEHQSMAQDLSETLAAHRADRVETVGAMRRDHQDSLEQMRRGLRTMLDETNKARHEAVAQFRDEAQQAQAALADDLRKASHAWHTFAAGTPPPPPTVVEPAPREEHVAARPTRKPGKKSQHRAS